MRNILVKCDDKVVLTAKTMVAATTSAEKKKATREGKRAPDPFFSVQSPRAREGKEVTVTCALC